VDADRPPSGMPSRRLLRGAERLQHLVGVRLLVGVTLRAPDGAVVGREQFCGRVLQVADGVVVVERPHRPSEPAVLPADPAGYEKAAPGRYVLATTGETVDDADYVTTWDVVADPSSDSSHRSSSRAP
jgi:hypothetical protein